MLSPRSLILTLLSLQTIECHLSHDQNVLAAPKATTGCGKSHTENPRLVTFNTRAANPGRQFGIYLPQDYDEDTPAPVILSFHGHHGTWDGQAALTHFNNPIVNPDHIAVFPQGLPGPDEDGETAWQGAPYARDGVDDVSFTLEILDFLHQNYCIDASRIYATGKSNGGGFCDTLACDAIASSRFAAFAMNSAALYPECNQPTGGCDANRSPDKAPPKKTCTECVGDEVPAPAPPDASLLASSALNCTPSPSTCNAAKPVAPILEFHGTCDNVMHVNGGCSFGWKGMYAAVEPWLAVWAGRAGCTGNELKATVTDNTLWKHISYDCAGATDSVQGYIVKGQGHWWMSPKPNTDNHGLECANHLAPLDASKIMMDFFNKNQRK